MKLFLHTLLCCCIWTLSIGISNAQVSAVNDSGIILPQGVSTSLDVTDNDDLDGFDPADITIEVISTPNHGGTAIANGTDIGYMAPGNYIGVETFDYRLSSPTSTSTATVYVSVTDPDDIAPTITCPPDVTLYCEPAAACMTFNNIPIPASGVVAPISSLTTPQGVVDVFGFNPQDPLVNHAGVISTNPPPAADLDLGSPNEAFFGGPGEGMGGGPGLYQNDINIGNVLIVTTLGNPQPADDHCCGATRLDFDFSNIGPITMESVDVFDLDDANQSAGAKLELFDEFDQLIASFQPPTTGDNGHVTIFAVDGNGDFYSGVYKVSYTINGSGSIDDFCFTKDEYSTTGIAEATDDFAVPPTIRFKDEIETLCDDYQVITRTWRAIDCAGNQDVCVQTITAANDLTNPDITCPADVTIDCTDDVTDLALLGEASATDACPGDLTVEYMDDVQGSGCAYDIVRTWKATDQCDNMDDCDQTIRVKDMSPPDLVCPPEITINCDSFDPANLGTASATDACNGVAEIVIVEESLVICNPGGRTYMATDDCGNVSFCFQRIYIFDEIAPVVTCDSDVTIECSDYVDVSDLGVNLGFESGDFSGYDVTVTPSGVGSCFNHGGAGATWVVAPSIPPTLGMAAVSPIEGGSMAVSNFDGEIRTHILEQAITLPDDPVQFLWNDRVQLNSLGIVNTLPRTYDVLLIDPSDNSVLASLYSFSLVLDGQYDSGWQYHLSDLSAYAGSDVIIRFIADVPEECTGPGCLVVDGLKFLPASASVPLATDNCTNVGLSCSTDVIQGNCPAEFQVVTVWTATDNCGNNSTCVQTTKIKDTTPPEITCPDDATVECPADISPQVFGFATATDNCSEHIIVPSGNRIDGDCPQEYVMERTWTATDACENANSCLQIIKVEDNTPPVIQCPPTHVVQCDAVVAGFPNAGEATAEDLCGPADVTFEDVEVDVTVCVDAYNIERTWTATDACGNATSCLQIISVVDNTKPVCETPQDITIECTDSTDPFVVGIPVASDNCDDELDYDPTGDTVEGGDCPQNSTITRKWFITDNCGNFTTCDQVIKVKDTVAPDLTCPDNGSIECDGAGNQAEIDAWLAQFSATDNCDSDLSDATLDVQMIMGGDMGNPNGLTLCYEDFSDLSDMMLNGEAAAIPNPVNYNGQDVLRLTNDLSQSGSAFLTNAVDLDNEASFSTYFTFQITDNQGCQSQDGADGLVFVVQTVSNTAGGAGGGIGYAGILKSVGVEFDTWDNGTQDGDNGNHIGINLNGDMNSVAILNYPTDFNNGSVWSAWVDYDGNTDELEVRVKEGAAAARPIAADLSYTVDLATVLEQTSAFVGFTSGTGCAGGDHDIRSWALDNTFNPISGCGKVVKATYTATDDCGNESTCVRTLAIVDTTPPEIACPEDEAYQCYEDVPEASVNDISAMDVCDDDLSISVSEVVAGDVPCDVTITRTWSASDDCNNGNECTQTIKVKDTMAPEMMCPPDATIECPADISTQILGFATATDNCSEVSIVPSGNRIDGDCPQEFVMERTWTATDICENANTCLQIIKVQDTTPPEINCPPRFDVECDEVVAGFPNAGEATAEDLCGTADVTFEDVEVDDNTVCSDSYTVERTWTATDACGNATSCLQIIKVDDTTDPVCETPQEIVLECTESTDIASIGLPVATDNCDDELTYDPVSDVTIAGDCDAEYTLTRKWFITDNCGNFTTCDQVIEVVDTQAPGIVCPDDITISCDADLGVANTGDASATDNCSTYEITRFDILDPVECIGSKVIYRTFFATDACGNESDCEQVITVKDEIAPEITCPPDLTLECNSPTDPEATGFASASDLCAAQYGIEGELTQNSPAFDNSVECYDLCCDEPNPDDCCTPPSGDHHYSVFTFTIDVADTYTFVGYAPVMDLMGGIYAGSFDPNNPCTNFVDGDDDSNEDGFGLDPLVITCPMAPGTYHLVTTTYGTNETGDFYWVISGTNGNLVNGTSLLESNVLVTSEDNVISGICPANMIIERTWTATDDCGNSAECTQKITVKDTGDPDLVCAEDVTIECTDDTTPGPNSLTGFSSATDACSEVVVDFDDMTVAGDCPSNYTINRTWTATDECGNAIDCVQKITVKDTQSPTISCPQGLQVECTDSTEPVATGSATADDRCSTVDVTFEDNIIDGECDADYDIQRTWTATDECGNATNCTQIIQVRDTQGPDITCPDNVTIECTDDPTAGPGTLTGEAVATDNCSDVTLSHDDFIETSNLCPANKRIHRIWSATDACYNSAQRCTQIIDVRDTQAPDLVCADNVTIECTESTSPDHTGTSSATDACSEVDKVYPIDQILPSDDCPENKTIKRTWIAEDVCGNATSCMQLIKVEDTTPPTISCPQPYEVECDDVIDGFPDAGEATAEDLCSTFDITFEDVEIHDNTVCTDAYTVERTWTATDACGNATSCLQIISVDDNTNPDCETPQEIVLECTESTDIASIGLPVATDNCDDDLTYDPVSDVTIAGDCDAEYTLTRKWFITDNCGNFTTCDQVIEVVDTKAPDLVCPDNITIECDESSDTADTGIASATDGCSDFTIHLDEVVDPVECGMIIVRTWSAVDACGNQSESCTQTIGVYDTTPPDLTCGPDVTIECTDNTAPGAVEGASATDNCTDVVGVSHVDNRIDGPCEDNYRIERTWTAVDDCGLMTTCVQNIKVQDITPPDLVCPGDMDINCSDDPSPANTGTASATDNCGQPVVSYTDMTVSGVCANNYTINRKWKAVDECGLVSECTQVITIIDFGEPSIRCEDVTIECDASTDPDDLPAVVATDNCTQEGDFRFMMLDEVAPGDCPQEMVITRKWRVLDECNNAGSCNQVITIVDTRAPFVYSPDDATIECTDDTSPTANGVATATDNCSDNLDITHMDRIVEGDCPQSYTIYRTWKAEDECGNVCYDNAAEVANRGFEAGFADWDGIGELFVGAGGSGIQPTEGNLFAVMETGEEQDNEVALEAFLDVPAGTLAGMSSTGSVYGGSAIKQLITVNAGETVAFDWNFITNEFTPDGEYNDFAFVFIVDDNGIVLANTFFPTFVPFNALPDFDEKTTWNHFSWTAPAGGSCRLAFGVVNVSDDEVESGLLIDNINNACPVQVIKVQDTQPPTIDCPDDLTVECTDVASTDFGEATAEDLCGAVDITVETTVEAGDCPEERTIYNKWIATDECGNATDCTQTIVVKDTEAPDLTCPGDMTIECSDFAQTPLGEATAPDACSTVDLTFEDVITPGDCPQEFTLERTYTATDACGNSTSCTQTITVVDTQAPVLTCPDPVTIECDEDNSPGAIIPPVAGYTGLGYFNGSFYYLSDALSTWTAGYATADASGGYMVSITTPEEQAYIDGFTGSEALWIGLTDDETYGGTEAENDPNGGWVWQSGEPFGYTNWVDGEPNNFMGANEDYVHMWIGSGEWNDNTNVEATTQEEFRHIMEVRFVTDNCGEVTVEYEDERVDGDCDNNYTIERTYTATDECGNATDCTQTITVRDTKAPVITYCPGDVTVECDESVDPADTGMATATDICSDLVDVTFEDNEEPGQCPVVKVIFRTWTATDDCGNATVCTQVITVKDTEGPTIECPDDITANADKFECYKTDVERGMPEVDDNCDEPTTLVGVRDDQQGLDDPYPVGTTIITWTVTGECSGLSASCTQSITIVDSQPPTIICKKISVALNDDNGMVQVPPQFMYDGVFDNCTGVEALLPTITVSQTIFMCTDFPEALVEVCATDEAGNTGCCFTTVKIQDNFAPNAVCEDITVEIDQNTGSAIITAEDVDGGSTDNADDCGLDLSIDTDEFQLPGNYVVTLTVTDIADNTDDCTANVKVTGVPGNESTLISGKIWIEGAMNATKTAMIPSINDLLPLTQPFGDIYGYQGTESVSEMPEDVIDWVLIQLRDADNPSTILFERAAWLLTTGFVVDISDGVSPVDVGDIPDGNYYLAVLHRNHLAVVSNSSVPVVNRLGVHDFTTGAAMGNEPMKLMSSGQYALWCGDLNADGVVDASDRSIAWNERNSVGYLQADATMDGVVDASERSITWNNRNKASGLPQ